MLVGGAVLLAVGGAAYAGVKLAQKDVDRIEEHTGVPPEELEDEDLNQAMQELNIQPQSLTPEEEAALAQQESAQNASPSTQATPAPSGEADYIAELEKLADLRDRGIITPEEFETKKKQILGI